MIDREDMSDPDRAVRIREGSNKHHVLTFLAAHADEAFRRGEIAEGAGVDENSIGAVLARLRDDGLVVHENGYWAIAEDERLGVLARMLEEVDELAGRFDVSDFPPWIRGG